jgi:soluble lytic murein transglycosylase-like protein
MKIAQGVVGFSLRYGVDARLVMAILMTESTFDPNEVSHAGARGLGQLMPDTARELGVRNVHDPAENIYGSVKLMRQHLDRYYRQTRGDGFQALVLSLAAYNAGPGAVRRHGGVPPYRETQRYIQKVQRYYRAFRGD